MSPQFWRGLRRQGAVAAGLGILVWLALRPASAPEDRSDPQLSHAEWRALDNDVSVQIRRDEDQGPDEAEAAFEELRQILLAYERRWAVQGPDSPEYELARINRQLAAGEDTEIPPEMRPLFGSAARYASLSGGLFDVRIGRLLQLWGLAGSSASPGIPPDPAALALATAALLKPTVGGPQAPQLDFSAIARGDAVDQVLRHLRDSGFGHAQVRIGEHWGASGENGRAPWTAALPAVPPLPADWARLELQDGEMLGTRRWDERSFEHAGQRYHDLIDPRSGYPAQGLRSVSVVTDEGARAAAASTALFVAGPSAWTDAARALGIEQALVIEADGTVRATPALARRLRLNGDVQVQTTPGPALPALPSP